MSTDATAKPAHGTLREPVGARYQDGDGWNGPHVVTLTERISVGTHVLTRWGRAVVIGDGWPDDPNYTVRYLPCAHHAGVSIEGTLGAFPSVYPDPSQGRS